MARSGEFAWIERYLAPLSGKDAFSLRDDAAMVPLTGMETPGERLVITQDAIMETVHFLPDDPVDTVAQKALRVNVSDIVSKGATPRFWSMALGVPDRWEDLDMERFASGLAADQERFGLTLTGGDTYRSPGGLCVSITMMGTVEAGHYKARIGARAGDVVFVSGTIGNSAVGLSVATGALQVSADDALAHIAAYRVPQPPHGLQSAIAGFATASMDISDGLLGDARKLATASNVKLNLLYEDIPVAPAIAALLKTRAVNLETVLSGGDDYQVLCTVRPKNAEAFRAAAAEAGYAVTAIGHVEPPAEGPIATSTNQGVSITKGGVALRVERESYSHF